MLNNAISYVANKIYGFSEGKQTIVSREQSSNGTILFLSEGDISHLTNFGIVIILDNCISMSNSFR